MNVKGEDKKYFHFLFKSSPLSVRNPRLEICESIVQIDDILSIKNKKSGQATAYTQLIGIQRTMTQTRAVKASE